MLCKELENPEQKEKNKDVKGNLPSLACLCYVYLSKYYTAPYNKVYVLRVNQICKS